MATIIKEKNMLYFTNNQNRTYSLDINKGGFISTQGKPMASVPSGFVACLRDMEKSEMSTLLRYMRYMHEHMNCNYVEIVKEADMLTICDKLDAIGFKPEYDWDIFHNDSNLKTIADNFKAFARAYMENNDIDIENFCKNVKLNHYIAKYHITNHYAIEDCRLVSLIESLENFLNGEAVYMAMHYVNKGLLEFHSNDGVYNITNKLCNFFEISKAIGHTPTKDDFYRQYINVMRTYRMRKQEIDATAIVNQLAKHSKAWDFENDMFTIIVPTSPADFEAEANVQHNCVFSTYMQKVVRGETNVVFVRKKDNVDHPFITCEVDNCGNIRQYLLHHNYSPEYGTAEMAFKVEFQEYLRSMWR